MNGLAFVPEKHLFIYRFLSTLSLSSLPPPSPSLASTAGRHHRYHHPCYHPYLLPTNHHQSLPLDNLTLTACKGRCELTLPHSITQHFILPL